MSGFMQLDLKNVHQRKCNRKIALSYRDTVSMTVSLLCYSPGSESTTRSAAFQALVRKGTQRALRYCAITCMAQCPRGPLNHLIFKVWQLCDALVLSAFNSPRLSDQLKLRFALPDSSRWGSVLTLRSPAAAARTRYIDAQALEAHDLCQVLRLSPYA